MNLNRYFQKEDIVEANRNVKEMLMITNHQGNENQHYNEISLHPRRKANVKKTKDNKICEDLEKMKPFQTLVGM
jgi:hypothetical protein